MSSVFCTEPWQKSAFRMTCSQTCLLLFFWTRKRHQRKPIRSFVMFVYFSHFPISFVSWTQIKSKLIILRRICAAERAIEFNVSNVPIEPTTYARDGISNFLFAILRHLFAWMDATVQLLLGMWCRLLVLQSAIHNWMTVACVHVFIGTRQWLCWYWLLNATKTTQKLSITNLLAHICCRILIQQTFQPS